MSELKAALEDDSTPSNQDTVSEEDDNLSDLESHTGSERDAASEAGSETPSLSDRSSQRASRSASNTPTNTRSTRSRDNPDFVAKQKSFMAKVQAATAGSEGAMVRPETPGKRRRDGSTFTSSTKKRKLGKTDNNGQDYQNDNYCWECHREGVFICCEMCPRVFHLKCAGMEKEPEEDWACSECHAVMQAENTENRSRSMQLISVEQLCTLLKYALNRLKTMAGMEPFTKPVDTTEFPTYEDIVVHPVDFTSLERNIKRKFYGSTEAFSADARWIVHNSVIFNGANSKVSSMARSLVKILKQEMSEIETCPDCYMNAHQNPKSWFTEVCRSAHPLIWARLKGFPFWPAKAVKWKDGNVDVRFFGRHDRSWVPIKECFLFSEQMPTPLKNRNKTLEACLQEVNEHIAKLREKFGKFKYAPHRIQFNPSDPDQIKIMLPNYKGPVPQRVRPQSRALSRLSAHSDDETSSIASTDSAGGMRRGRRESGTSSATQGTETETEVPTHTPEALRHRKSGSKSPSQEIEAARRRDCNQEREKSKDKEVPYSEEENVSLNALRPTDKVEEQEDEEMEDCGKYPGQKSSADNSDMEEDEEEEDEEEEECHQEEDESSSLVNGKSPVVKNEPGSEEETEEGGGGEGKSEGGGSGGGGGGSSDGEDEDMAAPASDKDGNEDETEETMKKDIKEEGEEEDDDNDDNKEEEEEEEEEEDEDEEEDDEEEQEEEEEEESQDKKELDGDSQTEVVLKIENNVKLEESVIQKTVIAKKTEDSCIGGENGMRSERIPSRENANKTLETNEVKDEKKVEEKFSDTLEKPTSEREEVKEKRRISTDKAEEKVTNNTKVNPTNEDGREERTSESKAVEIEERIKSEGEDQSTDDSGENDDDDEEMKEDSLEEKTVIPEDDEGKNESASEGESESESKRKEKSDDKQETEECKGDTRERKGEREKETEKREVERAREEEESRTQTMDKETEESSERMDTSESNGTASSTNEMEVDIKKEMEATRDEEEEEEQMEQEPQRQEQKQKQQQQQEIPEEQVIKEEMDTNEDFERRETVIREKEREDAEETARNSLMDAVQLMKTMGTIAITRLDGKSLGDRTNGDSITLSRKETQRAEESGEEDKRSTSEDAIKNCSKNVSPPTTKEAENKNMEQHISSLGCSVSVTKAVERDKDKEKDKVREKEREKEKVKMPSGVDTTRLSPSISIIPMSGGNDRQKAKTTTAPSSPDATTATSSTTSSHRNTSPSVGHNLPQSSPSSHSHQAAPARVSSSSSNSPQANTTNLPPPPPLSHPQAPPASSVGSRGVFGPPPPGSINMAGGRGPIMTTPGIRMVGGVGGPGMMVPARMPSGPPPRHLPPEAGPLSAQLHKHSQKLAEVMRATLEDILGGLVMTGTPEARVAALQLELERTNWRHQQEVAEVRHNADVMLVEMRANLEAEKQRAVDEVKRQMEAQMMEARRQMEVQMMERLAEVRRQMEAEKQRAVEETKRKQWCANCGKEALFFCCWNTSYCDYPCQQSHWPQHMSVCGQNSDGAGGGEGGPDSINGEASAHSSRVSTPVQNLVAAQQYVEDDGGVAALAEEHRRRKMRENASPIYGDMGMVGRGSPAGGAGGSTGIPTGSPNMAALSPGARGGMANLGGPAMAAMAAMASGSGSGPGVPGGPHNVKMHRYLPPTMIQQQQMYGSMDPRMMMIMGRGMPPGAAAMMRGPMHHFRPRFM